MEQKYVYVLYAKNQVGCICYESEEVAKEVAKMMSEQLSENWKVKRLIYCEKPF